MSPVKSEITVHLHIHHDDHSEVVHLLQQILEQGATMTAQLSDIQAQAQRVLDAVAAESTVDDSILALVQGNTDMITSLKQQLADAIAAGSDPAALQAVLDALTQAETSALSNAAKVQAAVTAGTPPPPSTTSRSRS
jgi:hypothetical protein